MLWRVAMISAGVVVGFCALTLVFPLTTMGDPAYDLSMLRARWYGGYYVFVPHILAVILAGVLSVRQRSYWALAAAILAAAAFWVIVTEEGRFIRFGGLTMPHGQAMQGLWLSKLASLALALAAVWALWRADARR